MQHATEGERIRAKTEPLVLRHHLDWAAPAAGDAFVDFGCASGEAMREAARRIGLRRVTGIDADPDILRFARAESDRQRLDGLTYRQAWVDGLGSCGLESNSHDHAWSRFFLEYHRDPLSAVREMVRVVRPGGKVTLIDIDGNGIWHYPLPADLERRLADVLVDLRRIGFDPRIGSKLAALARRAGLVEVRESIEPHHRIVGVPDEHTAQAWTRKLRTLKRIYQQQLPPERAGKADALDDLLAFILGEETMTWSLLHLVQGRKPSSADAQPQGESPCRSTRTADQSTRSAA
jgi:ubiquinone/menaquinone biosynthesis C-methylase UbiE